MVNYLIFLSHFQNDCRRYFNFSISTTNVVDVIGHMKLVSGQTLINRTVFDEVEITTTRLVLIRLQVKRVFVLPFLK